MTDFKGFIGRAKRLDDIDLPKLGHQIGVGEDEVHAVIDVETAGGGFDSLDRPKLLFEPHVFYRNLLGSKQAAAVKAGLAYPKWGTRPYPKDSYPRLKAAMEIDETAALKSSSWGLGQILGENFKMVGYATPQAMVQAFMDDEENHLAAMVAFIKAAHIDDDLRAHNWAIFARIYNGPGYAKNGYDKKLAAAYAKWAKIKDTPWTPVTGESQATVEIVPAPVPVPPPPDNPGPDPDPVFYPSPAPSGGVSASTGAAAVIVGGGLTTAAAAIDRWQVWLGLGVCVAFAAFIAFIVFRNQKD